MEPRLSPSPELTRRAAVEREPRRRASSPPSGQGWPAQLQLELAEKNQRTFVASRKHKGPLTIQRAFYPEGAAVPHLYLIHPPGGVVGGDRLSLDVELRPRARCLITTPGATKLYRHQHLSSVIEHRFRIHAGAALEWLPQETIAFDGAQAEVSGVVELDPGGHFFGLDVLCLGRPGCGEIFLDGALSSSWAVTWDGVPVWSECLSITGGHPSMNANWGYRGQPVIGSLCVVSSPRPGVESEVLGARWVDAARHAAGQPDSGRGTLVVTRLPVFRRDGGEQPVVCVLARYLGPCATEARTRLTRIWEDLRPEVLQLAACRPRVWAT